jgi:RNA polymerase sigma factor for flagellar operon FliA
MAVPFPDNRPASPLAEPEALFLAHRELIEQVIRHVGRRARLSPDEAEEFAARVRLRLVETRYEMLRRYEGRSSLRTYLTVVIQRLFLDYRVEQWGKWRPSAAARAAGRAGIRLEQLMVRDGYSFEQAVTTVRSELPAAPDRDALSALSERFPRRTRRHFEGEEILESMAAAGPDVERLLVREEEEDRFARITARLAALMGAFSVHDRLILQLRFEQDLTIADIARLLQIEQKPLYRKVDALLARLREALETEGVSAGDVAAMLGGGAEAGRANPVPDVRLFRRDGTMTEGGRRD